MSDIIFPKTFRLNFIMWVLGLGASLTIFLFGISYSGVQKSIDSKADAGEVRALKDDMKELKSDVKELLRRHPLK